ncbi:hypothetical protein LEP1GSC103_2944 [Leptospira borgpetersenii serovar Javanica str. UI 09931]|uniref:Uncharacterized protein n=4 Tax=Leptospira borgpetersenii TaxID=174 RepID=M3FG85_LEPBO|nr:hypothetical protein C4Q31_02080 [Leptospira borgpetersenii serovar Ceylonica]EKP12499.1 hypothetical protein LEP1GSC128_3139 [Leptospira borgpetersenii str. 200801926]EKQ92284.1 hypothetical protein LEP1GSC101_3288 [Leptospira borgpetersenii str. UI 09149]EMG00873.1 hypothetical protein LEP1GSC123_4450 [Leptospira borgpetersenii str. 200701203]EMK11756.1 hypothetical protein LEP1GSC066_0247 [Leptospira sp. serovar Kenya str. Sh9]EMN14288.1 hypothetical protein LEP1GSC055_2384 [Leptospira b
MRFSILTIATQLVDRSVDREGNESLSLLLSLDNSTSRSRLVSTGSYLLFTVLEGFFTTKKLFRGSQIDL